MANQKQNQNLGQEWRPDFEAALASSFSEFVCPPLPSYTSFGEWLDVVMSVVGRDVMPSQLSKLSKSEMLVMAQEFGSRFGCKAPKVVQIKTAIAYTLATAQWPDGA